MNEVITLSPADAQVLGDYLTRAGQSLTPVRVMIDEGGVKAAAGHHSWTPAIGREVDR